MITIPEEGAFGRPAIRLLTTCAQTMLAADARLEAIVVSIGFSNSVKGDVFKAAIKYEGIEEDDVDMLPLVRRFERHAAKAGHDLPLGDDDASPTLGIFFGRDRIDLRVGEDEIDIALVAERVAGDWKCFTVIDASLDDEFPISDIIANPRVVLEAALPEAMLPRSIENREIEVAPQPGEGIWRIRLPIGALRLGGGSMWGGTDD